MKAASTKRMRRSAAARHSARHHTAYGWLTSLLFHSAWLVSLGLLINAPPRGAVDEPQLLTGILLEPQADSETSTELESPEAPQPPDESPMEIELPPAPPSEQPIAEPSAAPAAETVGAKSPVAEATEVPSEPLEIPGGSIFDGLQPDVGERSGGGRWPRVTGGRARVSLFGVTGTGSKFVYLFDRSVSMYGPPLATAKAQLIQSLASLDSIHQFQVVFFNHRLTVFDHTEGQQRIAFATDDNKASAARFVQGISADGGTDRYAALLQAIRLRPDVIFFLTDADDPMPAGELAEVAARNRRVGASINTIEFGSGTAHGHYNFLVRLAEESGGQYGYVDTRQFGP